MVLKGVFNLSRKCKVEVFSYLRLRDKPVAAPRERLKGDKGVSAASWLMLMSTVPFGKENCSRTVWRALQVTGTLYLNSHAA